LCLLWGWIPVLFASMANIQSQAELTDLIDALNRSC
jgi:hypothetical protein